MNMFIIHITFWNQLLMSLFPLYVTLPSMLNCSFIHSGCLQICKNYNFQTSWLVRRLTIQLGIAQTEIFSPLMPFSNQNFKMSYPLKSYLRKYLDIVKTAYCPWLNFILKIKRRHLLQIMTYSTFKTCPMFLR